MLCFSNYLLFLSNEEMIFNNLMVSQQPFERRNFILFYFYFMFLSDWFSSWKNCILFVIIDNMIKMSLWTCMYSLLSVILYQWWYQTIIYEPFGRDIVVIVSKNEYGQDICLVNNAGILSSSLIGRSIEPWIKWKLFRFSTKNNRNLELNNFKNIRNAVSLVNVKCEFYNHMTMFWILLQSNWITFCIYRSGNRSDKYMNKILIYAYRSNFSKKFSKKFSIEVSHSMLNLVRYKYLTYSWMDDEITTVNPVIRSDTISLSQVRP